MDITAPQGTVYYTLDGSDPRLEGGSINPSALVATGNVTLSVSATVRTRTFDAADWSALNEAFFTVASPLRVSEIFYNPPGPSEATEFIELTNTSAIATLDLTDVKIGGVGNYQFLAGDANLSLAPGESIIVVKNATAFAAAYPGVPASVIASRPYTGSLDNGGETITLTDAGGGLIQQFTFSDDWYPETDGDGFSLVSIDPSGDYDLPTNWRSSALSGGSPGQEDAAPVPGDFNGDGQTSRADIARLLAGYGNQTQSNRFFGDINADGATTLVDLAEVQTHLGNSISSPAAPEAFVTTVSIGDESNSNQRVNVALPAVIDRVLRRGEMIESNSPQRRRTAPPDSELDRHIVDRIVESAADEVESIRQKRRALRTIRHRAVAAETYDVQVPLFQQV